jgi:hypothetical protein
MPAAVNSAWGREGRRERKWKRGRKRWREGGRKMKNGTRRQRETKKIRLFDSIQQLKY